MNKDKKTKIIMNLAIIALVLLILVFVKELFTLQIRLFMTAFTAILLPFSIALFISYLVAPIIRFMEKRVKLKNRLINTILIIIGLCFLLFILGRYAGVQIYTQGLAFFKNDWPTILDYFSNLFSEGTTFSSLYQWIVTNIRFRETDQITLDILSIFQSITYIIITIVLVPVFLFFILNDRDKIYIGIVSLFPKKWRSHVIELSKRANLAIEEYFNGRFVTMFVMSIFFTIIFWIIGFKQQSFLFGFMLGFFDIVPYIGPFIAIILPVLFSFTESDALLFGQFSPVAILIINIIGQMIQVNIAQPLIMGKKTKIHPLLILCSFVFFTYLFGIVGLILAIPITGTIKSTLTYIKEQNHEKMNLNKEEMAKIREERT